MRLSASFAALAASVFASSYVGAQPSTLTSVSTLLPGLASSGAVSSVASSAAPSSPALSSSAAVSSSVVASSAAGSSSAAASSVAASSVAASSSAAISSSVLASSVAASSASPSVSVSVSLSSAPASITTPPVEHTVGGPYNSGSGTESGWLTWPISSYTFSSFPVPSETPIPGTFQPTTPQQPPAVANAGAWVIPDFEPAWAAAYAKAEAFVAGLTLAQKVNVSTGVGWENGRCVGNVGTVGAWGGLCLEDSPLGVRDTDFVSAFPAGITVAATWNRTALRLRGLYMGQEFRGKGVHVALGPMMNMGRVPQAGRNWEGFGADPYLTGEAAYETVLGLQQAGVQACAKHYIDYEQEYKRTQESSEVDDKTNHEIYLRPFLRSVMAGTASVMCSYNLINDTYSCENDRSLNQLLKGELAFRGYVMSDWGAQMSTLSAVAGLDLSMPGDISLGSGTSWWGPNLTAFVENGTIPLSRVDDMATRILAGFYLLGQDADYPPVNFNAFNLYDEATNEHVDVQADHYKLVREIGAAGAVLLKNTNGALPLDRPRSLVIIGQDAGNAPMGPNGYSDRGGDDGVLAMGWGSGTDNFPYLVAPLDSLQERARKDGTDVSWWLYDWNTAGAAQAALQFDAAIVFVNADSGEGYITVDGNTGDRNNLSLWNNADNLIAAVASQNNNTIVVAHSVGACIIEDWIDNPNVTAVVWANIPGQEAGNAIVDVLYGAVNPSGRLPYTMAKNPSDYGTNLTLGGDADTIISIPYSEGIFLDYRHFDQYGIEPRFPFGHGLSYTTFAYSSPAAYVLAQGDATDAALEQAWDGGAPTPLVEGASVATYLHRPAFSVSFVVQNTGRVAGTEIPQLYVHFPAGAGQPPAQLKGFDALFLEPGESRTVTLFLSRYDLSVWNVEAQGWQKAEGTYTFSVGASSRDFRVNGTLPL